MNSELVLHGAFYHLCSLSIETQPLELRVFLGVILVL